MRKASRRTGNEHKATRSSTRPGCWPGLTWRRVSFFRLLEVLETLATEPQLEPIRQAYLTLVTLTDAAFTIQNWTVNIRPAKFGESGKMINILI